MQVKGPDCAREYTLSRQTSVEIQLVVYMNLTHTTHFNMKWLWTPKSPDSYTILTLSIGVTLTGYCTKCADKDIATHEVDNLYLTVVLVRLHNSVFYKQ